jgi:cyclic lactone autoinducer peptide
MKKKLMSNLSTNLCKTALSMALDSLGNNRDGCTFLLYEPKQPENLQTTDIKSLSKTIKRI